MLTKLKETLEEVSQVSTIQWMSGVHTIRAMTVHWIDEKSLRRCKAALACTHITGRHTYDVLAENISRVHEKFKW